MKYVDYIKNIYTIYLDFYSTSTHSTFRPTIKNLTVFITIKLLLNVHICKNNILAHDHLYPIQKNNCTEEIQVYK